MFNPDSLKLPFFDDSHRALYADIQAWSAAALTNRVHVGSVDEHCVKLTRQLGDAGWLRYCVPAEYGGALKELDSRSLCLMRQALGYYDGLADFAFVMQGLGSGPISLFGSEALKQKYLPHVASGKMLAAFALSENAGKVIGVDHQAEMLEMFAANALNRGIKSETHLGFWPAIASSVSNADVVTVHNVFYNVSDVIPFILELNMHANKRVVIEMPALHPLATLSGAWKYFWNIERPTEPTPDLLIKVLAELGIRANFKYWSNEVRKEVDPESTVEFMRIRLCLPTSRSEEIRSYLSNNPPSGTRELATIWWDRM